MGLKAISQQQFGKADSAKLHHRIHANTLHPIPEGALEAAAKFLGNVFDFDEGIGHRVWTMAPDSIRGGRWTMDVV
jgi:hypothetical protein